jgi:hypothetical protein
MLTKYSLEINGEVYDIPDTDLVNWEEITCAVTRKNMDGIVRQFSSKFKFAGETRSRLLSLFLSDYMSASASMTIYQMTDTWEWEELFKCPLDFSSLTYNRWYLEVSTIDSSIAAKIKANGKTTYEYSVSELKESKQLYNDRISLYSEFENKIYGDNTGDDDYDEKSLNSINLGETACLKESEGGALPIHHTILLPTYYIEPEENYVGTPHDQQQTKFTSFDKNGEGTISISADNCMLEFLKDVENIEIRFKLGVSVDKEITGGTEENKGYTFSFQTQPKVVLIHGAKGDDGKYTFKALASLDWYVGMSTYIDKTITLSAKEGDVIALIATVPYITCIESPSTIVRWETYTMYTYKVLTSIEDKKCENPSVVTILTKTELEPVKNDIIKPINLLSKLVESACGHAVNCSIDASGEQRLDNAMIMAAESARLIKDAKIYTSFNDFADWMETVFGYIYVTDDEANTLRFMHRNTLFVEANKRDIQTISSDVDVSVDSSQMYSSIKVGYDKVDYDMLNGRDEFRFTNEFTTGNILTDNTLELISPYRADAYGIEFLIIKSDDGDTTDDSSDNDVFFVCAEEGNEQYTFIRNGYTIIGVISPNQMFNAMYSPKSMLEANSTIIGCYSNKLTFASSDGNSDVSINGVSETDDFTPNGKLYLPIVAIVETPEYDLMNHVDDVVNFQVDDSSYSGYIKEIKCNVGKNCITTLEIQLKSIEI